MNNMLLVYISQTYKPKFDSTNQFVINTTHYLWLGEGGEWLGEGGEWLGEGGEWRGEGGEIM